MSVEPVAHDLSGGAEVLERVARIARAALAEYDIAPAAGLELISVSENAIFTVDDPRTGLTTVLRIHRGGYHSPAAISSELAWLSALRDDTGIRTPRVIPSRTGAHVISVAPPEGGAPRNVVMFEQLPGTEPAAETLVADFTGLGALTARMHQHARRWVRPPAFERFVWDHATAFGPAGRWGRWQDGLGVDGPARAILGRLDRTLERRLASFGRGPDRFGLIHADLRLANLLVVPGSPPAVIDFDDCGFGWYLYDFGAAVSFIEHDPRVPDMLDAWLTGYRSVEPLSPTDADEIATFVMYRRLLLVAWIGSHSAADIARQLGAGYTTGSCELAEQYLTRCG